ncbi:MAG: C45 family peptidase [Granulosicoccus sp.]|nr:C45 family peptidase [Granulosicoccus sp.]
MTVSPPRHIKVHGAALERGRQYGEQAADLIVSSLQTYRRIFEICGISWEDASAKAYTCLDTVQQRFPALIQELKGIANGSAQDFDSLFTLNCRTEILPPDFLARVTKKSPTQLPDGGHISECTTVAFTRRDSPMWLAQTWDWVGLQRQAMVVLESHPDDAPSHITVAEAGMPAKIGFNEYGLGITLNILRSSLDGKSPGMPVHLFLRALLDCHDVDEAKELAASLSFAGSSNIMIADAKNNLCSIEASPKAVRFIPASNGTLCHTNHFLEPELAGLDAGLTGNISTESRLSRAQDTVDSLRTLEDIHSLLGNTEDGIKSVCRYPDQSLPAEGQIETVVGVAMNLTDQALWVSAAQPADHDFELFPCKLT